MLMAGVGGTMIARLHPPLFHLLLGAGLFDGDTDTSGDKSFHDVLGEGLEACRVLLDKLGERLASQVRSD